MEIKDKEPKEDETLDPSIQLLVELVFDMCLGEDEKLAEASQAHGVEVTLEGDEPDTGFLTDSSSWNIHHVPNLPPLKTRAYEDYMATLRFDKFSMHDHLMIVRRLPKAQYTILCLRCNGEWVGKTKDFHIGRCKMCELNRTRVHDPEEGKGVSPHYSSGARVISSGRKYTPK